MTIDLLPNTVYIYYQTNFVLSSGIVGAVSKNADMSLFVPFYIYIFVFSSAALPFYGN